MRGEAPESPKSLRNREKVSQAPGPPQPPSTAACLRPRFVPPPPGEAGAEGRQARAGLLLLLLTPAKGRAPAPHRSPMASLREEAGRSGGGGPSPVSRSRPAGGTGVGAPLRPGGVCGGCGAAGEGKAAAPPHPPAAERPPGSWDRSSGREKKKKSCGWRHRAVAAEGGRAAARRGAGGWARRGGG